MTDLDVPTDWERRDGAIHRSYRFADFRAAFGFMTRAARVIDRHDHHPDWRNRYGRVDVTLTTYSAGGVTERDVTLARELDRLAEEGDFEW